MLASFSDYLPLGDLGKILVVCLAVAVVAPTSVSVAIIGLERRDKAEAAHSSPVAGYALLVIGVGVLLALIGAGIYILVER